MPFIMNAWYVAAWPDEVTADKLLARTICNQAMVLFRDGDQQPVALEDRCCHREMPLSLGWLENCTVRCGYHGLRFDTTGACVEIPGQPSVPARVGVRAFPAVQKYGWVWVWPGAPERADEALIPRIFERNDHPDWTSVGSTTYLRCHYELISDNLLDLTHETFIHRSSLGHEAIPDNPITVTSDEQSVTVTRWILDHDPAPFWKAALGQDVNCDRWQIINFMPPANLVLDVGVAPANTGAQQGRRSHGAEGCNLNAITPETEDTTWYFWAFARRFKRDDAALSDKLREAVRNIFEEDRAAVEAVHQVMLRNPGRPVVNIRADAGSIQARRLVARLLEQEELALAGSH